MVTAVVTELERRIRMSTDREREMAEAIARAEQQDELDEGDATYKRPQPSQRVAGNVYTFRLPDDRREQLQESARMQGIPPSSLIRRWVEERLDQEARRAAIMELVESASSDMTNIGAAAIALAGSRAVRLTFDSMKDIDVMINNVRHVASSDMRVGDLIAIAGVIPNLSILTADVHRKLSSAMAELDDVKEQLVAAMGEVGFTDSAWNEFVAAVGPPGADDRHTSG
jgi:hypothetical protein